MLMPESTSILSLPDDLILNCLARVSRLYYPTLSLVSKSFRSLLASPELYKARSLCGRTETCLYVCLECCNEYRWYTLYRKPKSSEYFLARVPIPYPPVPNVSGLVAVGSSIYNFGPRVSILDCQSHTWQEGPSFQVELKKPSASILDDKIYVGGCYRDVHSDSFKNSFEVFDTKTQLWDPKTILCPKPELPFACNLSPCIDGKLYVLAGIQFVAYITKEGRWNLVKRMMWGNMLLDPHCVIDNVLYSASRKTKDIQEAIRWYDFEANRWRSLTELVRLPGLPHGQCVSLTNYDGNMAVLWEKRVPWGGPFGGSRKKVWCAVIALERSKSCEIRGNVKWFDHVLTTFDDYEVAKVLAVTV